MDYILRQFRLHKFVQMLKSILNNPNLATDRMPKEIFYERIKESYFQETDPLESKRNKTIFPRATTQFEESIENEHTLASMEGNLDFLRTEFDSYFDDLVGKDVLISNNDNPPAFRLNHNSAMVYWIVGFGIISGFVWQVIKIFFQKP